MNRLVSYFKRSWDQVLIWLLAPIAVATILMGMAFAVSEVFAPTNHEGPDCPTCTEIGR